MLLIWIDQNQLIIVYYFPNVFVLIWFQKINGALFAFQEFDEVPYLFDVCDLSGGALNHEELNVVFFGPGFAIHL